MGARNDPLSVESLCDTDRGSPAARLSGLPAEVRALHRKILRAFLATGQAPHLDDLPPGPGIDRKDAVRCLAEGDLVHVDAEGSVVVAYPFSGRPTGHLVRLADGPTVHAMCAIDALGIPLMAGWDAVIVSTDPSDGHPIRVERHGDEWRWSLDETVVLIAQSSAGGPAAECLCPAITFHTSRRRAEAYLRTRPGWTGLVLDRNRAVDVARRLFGSLLAPDTVEMLCTAGCPNAENYLPRLRQLLADVGVAEPVRVIVIASVDQAQHERFLGSPTIRINGRDVDPTAHQRRDYGLSCRLYRGPDGLHGTPPDEWLLTQLNPDNRRV